VVVAVVVVVAVASEGGIQFAVVCVLVLQKKWRAFFDGLLGA
jgi:hypothetical protein